MSWSSKHSNPKCPTPLPSLESRVFLVTGGNTGIGYSTCLHLAGHSARVYMGARSPEKAAQSIAEIQKIYPEADVRPLILDHTSLASVTAAAETFKGTEKHLHGLVNCAGIMATPYSLTQDGHEIQWQTNYLAHWYLTNQLLPVLLETAKLSPRGHVRIVNVSSDGHARFPPKTGIDFANPALEDSSAFTRYGQSKLANVLHAKTLHARYGPGSGYVEREGGKEIWVSSVHPGHVNTQLNVKASAHMGFSWLQPILKCTVLVTPDEGAKSNLFCVASNDYTHELSGKYFNEKAKVTDPSKLAMDEDLRVELEVWTEGMMRKKGWLA